MKLGRQKDLCCISQLLIREINISLNILCTVTNYVIRYRPYVARDTVQLPTRATPDCIPPPLWPLNSPYLNRVDYRVCCMLQERVYRENIWTLDELWQRITEEWECMDQRVNGNAVKQRRQRLRAFLLVFLQTADILNICCKIPMSNSFGNKC